MSNEGSGEQPTSVDKQINRYLGNHLYRFDYEDINHIKALISEERRQAKIEILEYLAELDRTHTWNNPEMTAEIAETLITLRGENNE